MRKYSLPVITLLLLAVVLLSKCSEQKTSAAPFTDSIYHAPDTSLIPHDKTGEMIRYGRELIINTAYYIGPEGTVGKYLGNKMNCQNCHLDAGTRPYGLNYFSSHARYPQYRAREGNILTLADRVNNCIERPHNGKALPLGSKEMLAIVTYMKWLSTNIPVDGRVEGDKLKEVAFMDRAADPERGRIVYEKHCLRCHGADGAGKMRADGVSYEYPPLWGPDSYQPGSSMHRVVKMAQFVKYNMPFGVSWKAPELSDEEALDVAAYVNDDKHKRPSKDMGFEYPSFEEKPIDFHLGPYTDPFSALQHKFGPWNPIIKYRKENKLFIGF